jgi:hypothetical protein
MQSFATGFDPALVSATDAVIVDDAAAIERMAAAVKSLAAARVADTELWKRDGDRSADHQLARTTGVSVHQAQDTLQTARRLAALPETTRAALAGDLSAQQTAVIADAATADPDAERKLLEQAPRVSRGCVRRCYRRARRPVPKSRKSGRDRDQFSVFATGSPARSKHCTSK